MLKGKTWMAMLLVLALSAVVLTGCPAEEAADDPANGATQPVYPTSDIMWIVSRDPGTVRILLLAVWPLSLRKSWG